MANKLLSFLFIIMSASLSATTSGMTDFCMRAFKCPIRSEISKYGFQYNPQKFSGDIRNQIRLLSSSGNTQGLITLSDSLRKSAQMNSSDTSFKADVLYYSGVCQLLASRHRQALADLQECIKLKKIIKKKDDIFGKALYNAGIASTYLGEYFQVINYMTEYTELAGLLFSSDGAEMIEALTSMAGASTELHDHESFVGFALRAIGILKSADTRQYPYGTLRTLYSVIGVGYARMGEYAKARIYLENAEAENSGNNLPTDDHYINLINSLAITYGYLGLEKKSAEYLSRGIDLAVNNNSDLAFNMLHSYAVTLGRSGKILEGEALLESVVKKARQVYGNDSRLYIQQLKNYAGYLTYYSPDNTGALREYVHLLNYVSRHSDDSQMNGQILAGYSRALYRNGDYREALSIISTLLAGKSTGDPERYQYTNPDIGSLNAGGNTLSILQLKHDILWDMYRTENTFSFLESAAETAGLIIGMIDKIRITISEEESRIVLGDRYRIAYLHAIRDFELCFTITGENRYMEKAFEFAERSKVAGLLAATRQLKAIQFHIPVNLAEKENSLQRMISFYGSRIAEENEKENPDEALIESWNERMLSAVAGRDSLINTFEKDFPGYYSLKYNTRVPAMKDIPALTGRNSNYINYVIADSVIYIFLVNRKYHKIFPVTTDSLFMKKLADFRSLLSDPSQSKSARSKFDTYQDIGHELYNILIGPVGKYLISDNLLISTDNILSYLPFETFLSKKYSGDEILYRKLDYLMNDYNISYVYSAAFLNENLGRRENKVRNMIAFAPSYLPGMNYDTLIRGKSDSGTLRDLPYAINEAEYAAAVAKGEVFLHDEATETLYKDKAGDYSIIHLAMHTILDDQNPMNSALIFSSSRDTLNDGLLYTYEIYGIPLRASMIVLSSCNTGSGVLSTGEGILSLSRGFLYSGSQSVVLSLWKVDDKSGTDIVRMFYDNLQKGMKKNLALRKARNRYLEDANQLKSHPYFWSTLVIFGDNSPLFRRTTVIPLVSAIILAAGIILFVYLRKLRSS
ncbi:MAG TPA: CHAT domain-containing protein [Bacteroidales bacterium]|nr:CHAT domain-containing protein [Bacteroidales bacterium]HPR11234.1 CHAT domain-containing protein [Bacteroidales bacterium]HRW85482.1 CHAT domain-containing protein [Bacteroidales bacterium]